MGVEKVGAGKKGWAKDGDRAKQVEVEVGNVALVKSHNMVVI